MATTSQKLDFLWKLVHSKGFSSPYKSLYEEVLNGQSSQIYAENIWIESQDIPSTPPISSTSIIDKVVNLQLTPDNSVSGNRVWIACADTGDPLTRLSRWIPNKFGYQYTVKIFDDDSNQIHTTDAIDWQFFYEHGIFICNNNPVTKGKQLPLYLSGYRYIGDVGVVEVEVDKNFTFTVAEVDASSTWVIAHGLAKYPSVTVMDADGNELHPLTKQYTNINKVTLTWASNRFGTAYLN